MRITCIPHIRDKGIFSDFEWPKELPEFGQYNLVYGWNGTGKTTLSRVFRDLELRRSSGDGEVKLCIDGNDVSSKRFHELTFQIRVFNHEFIQENIFRADGGDIPPIFVVGKESVEKQKEADRLKAELGEKKDELNKTQTKKNQEEGALEKYCSDRARVIKETLRASGSSYNEYDKRGYKEKAEEIIRAGDAAKYRLSDPDRESLLAQHRASPKPKVSEVAYRLPDLGGLADNAAKLLGTTVVSAAIQALKDDSALADWTRHGLGLHKERTSDLCLFCEQPLPKVRLAQLEAHFNAEYERFLQEVEEQIRALESAKKGAAEVKLPNRAELYDYLAADFDAAETAFRKVLDAVHAFLGQLIGALSGKKAKPFEAQTLRVLAPSDDVRVVDPLNEVIGRHNQACDGFTRRVSAARDRLASDMIAESVGGFVQLGDAVVSMTDAVNRIDKEIKEHSDQITQIERDIKDNQRPAEELNEDLKRYLGHGALQLTIKATGYAITRSGEPANMLSEGEMSAIALLYFLKSLQDREFAKANGVVVLDDPVSSLDANALYLAFGLIRTRTEHAGQLFILTHNFAFFRQVRNWFHHLPGQNKKDQSQRPARFYMLDCMQDGNYRCSSIRLLDPLLEKYESEYHYLFARIYRAAKTTPPPALEQNYILPNMARRLLEAFLAFRQPQMAGQLWQKLQAVDFDETSKARICRFVNTHSHSDTIGEPEHDPSSLGEAQSVLAALLDLIKSQDIKHFEGMEKLSMVPNGMGDNE